MAAFGALAQVASPDNPFACDQAPRPALKPGGMSCSPAVMAMFMRSRPLSGREDEGPAVMRGNLADGG